MDILTILRIYSGTNMLDEFLEECLSTPLKRESSTNEVRRLSKPLLSILDRTCARLSFFEIISTIRI